jgi:predicted Fe-Mo cluster-binding NifX family protein
MKIAAVTEDGQHISPHFGRATHYMVITVENNQIVARELREKASHRDFQQEGSHSHQHQNDPAGHGYGRHSAEKHQRMFATLSDCGIVLARGMGRGAHEGLLQMGLRPILTDLADIDVAVAAVIDETISDHPERLH